MSIGLGEGIAIMRKGIQEGVIKYGTPRGKDALGEQRHSRHAIEPIYYGLQF